MTPLRTAVALAVGCAGLAAADGAHAASYDVIRTLPDSVTLLDRNAVEAVGQGEVRRARSVSVQKNLVSGGPQEPGYVITLNEYDCARWTIRWTGFSVYSRFGALVLHKDNADPAWAPIDNKNVEAAAGARLICEGRSAGSVYTADTIGTLVLALMQAWDAETPLPPLQPAAGRAKKPAGKTAFPKSAKAR
jgi:hypothetical protein